MLDANLYTTKTLVEQLLVICQRVPFETRYYGVADIEYAVHVKGREHISYHIWCCDILKIFVDAAHIHRTDVVMAHGAYIDATEHAVRQKNALSLQPML